MVKILHNWTVEGSSVCLFSTSDGQALFGKRRSCYEPRGVDPSSLGKQRSEKQTPVRGIWTATEANARIAPSVTHLSALWDKKWACNQGCISVCSTEEFSCPQTAAICCSLHLIYKRLPCQRLIQTVFHIFWCELADLWLLKTKVNFLFLPLDKERCYFYSFFQCLCLFLSVTWLQGQSCSQGFSRIFSLKAHNPLAGLNLGGGR